MTVTARGGAPDLPAAAKLLGVAEQDIDSVFGVVPIDPEHGTYAVQVRSEKLSDNAGAKPYAGPWSDPSIEPFGPVREPKKP